MFNGDFVSEARVEVEDDSETIDDALATSDGEGKEERDGVTADEIDSSEDNVFVCHGVDDIEPVDPDVNDNVGVAMPVRSAVDDAVPNASLCVFVGMLLPVALLVEEVENVAQADGEVRCVVAALCVELPIGLRLALGDTLVRALVDGGEEDVTQALGVEVRKLVRDADKTVESVGKEVTVLLADRVRGGERETKTDAVNLAETDALEDTVVQAVALVEALGDAVTVEHSLADRVMTGERVGDRLPV